MARVRITVTVMATLRTMAREIGCKCGDHSEVDPKDDGLGERDLFRSELGRRWERQFGRCKL